MRLRNIPGSREAIAASGWCIQEPEKARGGWNHIFGNEHPIHIEIGMGQGDAQATAWGCDLTHKYVDINADYRS